MFSIRKFFVFAIAVFMVSAAAAQNSSNEQTVEASYLQQTMELMIIRETARSSTREQKMIALGYIEDAINRGSTNDEIRQTLEYLCSEGRNIRAYESGRLANNFPDIRWRAARLLGDLGTEEARLSLMGICRNYRNEDPTVIKEAILSLGKIGVNNEENDAVRHIAWAAKHYHDTNPDSGVAIAVIIAYRQIAEKNDGLKCDEAIEILNNISAPTAKYEIIVREGARQLLADMRSQGSSSN